MSQTMSREDVELKKDVENILYRETIMGT